MGIIKPDEILCTCGSCMRSKKAVLRPELRKGLEKLRDYCDFTILRGVLCKFAYEQLKEGSSSYHNMGYAVDITSNNFARLVWITLLIREFRNIVIYSDYIHVDVKKSRKRVRCGKGGKIWLKKLGQYVSCVTRS